MFFCAARQRAPWHPHEHHACQTNPCTKIDCSTLKLGLQVQVHSLRQLQASKGKSSNVKPGQDVLWCALSQGKRQALWTKAIVARGHFQRRPGNWKMCNTDPCEVAWNMSLKRDFEAKCQNRRKKLWLRNIMWTWEMASAHGLYVTCTSPQNFTKGNGK